MGSMLCKCGFSERQFEFCFNHEFVNRYQAFLNEMPYVPNQNEEGDVNSGNAGCDVKYVLRDGDRVRSLFFQHKIPSLLTAPSPRYPHEWEFHSGEYYYFKLHKKKNGGYEQHNMLVNLSDRGHYVFYSSPIFNDKKRLNRCFCDATLIENAICVRPLDIGIIEDKEPHRVSYTNITGSLAGFSSHLFKQIPSSKISDIIASMKKVEIGEEYFLSLLNDLLRDWGHMTEKRIKLPRTISKKTTLSQINYVLEKYYNLSWFMIS